ncbi:hypothetical protein D8674_000275 [Pyrus ussuriensis x Pyrus communis]|uniref:Uncharacterized protein n=1 Tax=Pyrus ussuriensis x Pyrus communis TaxID=2448454 RepID=A0A5N5F2Z5_9ROSA|nr:hypothetical protein D8674_000275 [Pyrus ussuriensis x Pyrus communis]
MAAKIKAELQMQSQLEELKSAYVETTQYIDVASLEKPEIVLASWKAKMKYFLCAQGDKVLLTVKEGWEPPMIKETEELPDSKKMKSIALKATKEEESDEGSFVKELDLEEVLRKYYDPYDIIVQIKMDNSNLRKKLALVESEKKTAKVEHQSLLDNGEKLRGLLVEKIHIL